jgi:hypothetical protein
VRSLDFKKTALQIFKPVDPFLELYTHMNNSHNETVTRQGKTYLYDPDHDCYYAVHSDRSRWDSYGWLAVILALSTVALYFEFYPIR